MGTDFTDAVHRLTRDDPRLAAIVTRHGVPAVFRRPPTFATLVLIILEQQVSLGSAAAAFRRLGEVASLDPRSVLALDDPTLSAVGFSRQKMRYVRALAAAIDSGDLGLESLAALPDAEVRHTLMRLPGVGPWTADVFLLSSLGRPDVWPIGDRALQVGAAEVLGLPAPPSPADLEVLGEPWRPWRSAAAQLIWHHYLSVRRRQD